jgi:hypothetical protein
MNSRADTHPVGTRTARANRTTRRGTPWQDRSPFDLCPSPAPTLVTAAPSAGPSPAHPRHAISTREHQTGGAPTRTAPTRRAHQPRPPPGNPAPALPAPPLDHPLLADRVKDASGVAARSTTSILDPLCLPRCRRRSRQGAHRPAPKPSPTPPGNGHTPAMPYSHLTGPFHIRSPIAAGRARTPPVRCFVPGFGPGHRVMPARYQGAGATWIGRLISTHRSFTCCSGSPRDRDRAPVLRPDAADAEVILSEVVTYAAAVYPAVLDDLLPSASHGSQMRYLIGRRVGAVVWPGGSDRLREFAKRCGDPEARLGVERSADNRRAWRPACQRSGRSPVLRT